MTPGAGRPSRVLAVMDGSDCQIAVLSAAALAQSHGAALEVIACVELPSDLSLLARLSDQDPKAISAEMMERERERARARLASVLPGRPLDPSVAVGKAYMEIVRHVAATGCDYVVKTAKPLSAVHRYLFTSTDQHLLRKCPCPVWLQTPEAPVVPRRILAAVDLNVRDAVEPDTLREVNGRVVAAALGLATAQDAEIVVLHAWDAAGEALVYAFSERRQGRIPVDGYVQGIRSAREEEMQRFMAAIRETHGPSRRLTSRLVRGAPAQVIEEQSRDLRADVVVLGTVARTGLHGVLIGNTAENIINGVECPVLAVKPEGFVSPLLSG